MKKKSLKDAFNAADVGSAAIGIATVTMGAAIAPVGIIAGIVGMAGVTMGLGFRKKPLTTALEDTTAETPAPEEIEISVETGAPVKAMKTIRLRR